MVNEYCESLAGFKTEVLRRGMELWRDENESRFWPVPGELRGFMVRAERELNPRPESHLKLEPPSRDNRSAEEVARVAERFPRWQQALQWGLKDEVFLRYVETGELPEDAALL